MFKKISFLPLSVFPIALIMGNFAINLNIIIIDLFLLYYCYKSKNWSWMNNIVFRLLIIFYLYLVSNSLISYFLSSHSNLEGLIRSIGFIKFILLGYAFNLLVQDHKILNKIMTTWFVIISIVIFDVFFEKIFGHNTLGYVSPDLTRIISFFKDEMVVGSLILTFGFIVTTYFLNKDLKIPSKIFFNFLLLIIPLSILISGERSNFIKSFIIFFLIIYLIKESKLLVKKYKFVLLIIFTFCLSGFLSQNIYTKQTEFIKRITIIKNPEKFTDRFKNIKYFAHYDVAIKIFLDHPILGIGNKNFRHICHNEKYFNSELTFAKMRCNTHPHQVHLEILSEHGLIGYLLLFSIFFIFIKKNFIYIKLTKNIFDYSTLIYLTIFFLPILPSGAFFSSFNGALFWIIFSIANLNRRKLNY